MVEDENGNPITQDVGPHTTVYVPGGRYLATLNTGTQPMTLFVVYSPPALNSPSVTCRISG